MEVQEKYLPTIPEQQAFLKNRIEEYKRQVLGGKLECRMAEVNGEKRTITTTEDMMKQIINNIDILTEEYDSL
jgi:hypothetical protein